MTAKLPEAPNDRLCENCGNRVAADEVLIAYDPFCEGQQIEGCPHCRAAERLIRACVVEGCVGRVCSGAPSAHGYRYAWTCREHGATEASGGE